MVVIEENPEDTLNETLGVVDWIDTAFQEIHRLERKYLADARRIRSTNISRQAWVKADMCADACDELGRLACQRIGLRSGR